MIAAVLAKRSERFPGKHMQKIGDRTMIGGIVDRLLSSGLFDEVVVYTRDPDVRAKGAIVMYDDTGGTAVNSIESLVDMFHEVFIIAGDMPAISTGIISSMLSAYHGKPLFPVHSDGKLEPMHGIYNESMDFASYIRSGGKSLKGLIEKSGYEAFSVSPDDEPSFTNINYSKDLEKLGRKR